jgi:hypothetical protein
LPFCRRYSPRDFICDQLDDYDPDRIERGGSGEEILTPCDASLLGLDVLAGAGTLCFSTSLTEMSLIR